MAILIRCLKIRVMCLMMSSLALKQEFQLRRILWPELKWFFNLRGRLETRFFQLGLEYLLGLLVLL